MNQENRPDIEALYQADDVEGLLQALLYRPDVSTQYEIHKEVTEAFRRLGESVIPALIAHLHSDSHLIKAEVASILGELGDVRAMESLIALLQDKFNLIHHAAAKALGDLGNTRAVEPLIAALKNNQSLAAKALGQLG